MGNTKENWAEGPRDVLQLEYVPPLQSMAQRACGAGTSSQGHPTQCRYNPELEGSRLASFPYNLDLKAGKDQAVLLI